MESAEDGKEEGVKICVETIKRLHETPGVKGVHIMPVMWESITQRIVEESGLMPRPIPKPVVEESAVETVGVEQK